MTKPHRHTGGCHKDNMHTALRLRKPLAQHSRGNWLYYKVNASLRLLGANRNASGKFQSLL
ncbi:MAG TPA: hypothetical protein VK629_06285 [Steroidobacteraceae bacterium]|nr:hypothetical protein [Steroidobacteraceae bacterium]